MTKQQKARDFAYKMAPKWVETNAQESAAGRKPFDLEWMLGHAWKVGFDAGQTMSNDKSRAAFESWAVQEGLYIEPFDGEYLWGETAVAWLTWQACRKVALNEAAEVCANLTKPSKLLGVRDLGAWDIATLDCEAAIMEMLK